MLYSSILVNSFSTCPAYIYIQYLHFEFTENRSVHRLKYASKIIIIGLEFQMFGGELRNI